MTDPLPARFAPHNPTLPASLIPPQEMINASELREFIFCERAWALTRQGLRVSLEQQKRRALGVRFHETRAVAANRSRSPRIFWCAIILILAGVALLLADVMLSAR
jgi:hypothetical protein